MASQGGVEQAGVKYANQTAWVSYDPDQVKLTNLKKAIQSTIHQPEFFLSLYIYNVVGTPIASRILYPFTGFQIHPMIAGAATALKVSFCGGQ